MRTRSAPTGKTCAIQLKSALEPWPANHANRREWGAGVRPTGVSFAQIRAGSRAKNRPRFPLNEPETTGVKRTAYAAEDPLRRAVFRRAAACRAARPGRCVQRQTRPGGLQPGHPAHHVGHVFQVPRLRRQGAQGQAPPRRARRSAQGRHVRQTCHRPRQAGEVRHHRAPLHEGRRRPHAPAVRAQGNHACAEGAVPPLGGRGREVCGALGVRRRRAAAGAEAGPESN